MKNTQFILTNLIGFLIGMSAASFWITESETYKITFPIVLILFAIKISFYIQNGFENK